MQRLFSTFANGWPGAGILLQRILTGTLLVRLGVVGLSGAPFSFSMLPPLIGSLAGILFLVGLWTPLVGVLIAGLELWAIVIGTGDLSVCFILFTLGGTIAMIGPGAWSLDAHIFGRKRF